MTEPEREIEAKPEPIEVWQFLTETPPNQLVTIRDYFDHNEFKAPPIPLYCRDDMCRAVMWFDLEEDWGRLQDKMWKPINLHYYCRLSLPKIPFLLIPNDLRTIASSREDMVDDTGVRAGRPI